MAKRYAAPMEGLTTWLWRRVHAEIFGGADKYFTPFLSPNDNCAFQKKELREIDNTARLPVVPQILTARAEHLIWASRELASRGFEEINLNAGCPSGTVTAKHKGAGLLCRIDELDALLDAVFTALPAMRISVKTRVGYASCEEWQALLALYNRYPIHELIVHPRIRKDFYTGTARRSLYAWTKEHTDLPLVYNGDVTSPRDPAFAESLMAGRGLLRDPALFRRASGGTPASREELGAYVTALAEGYEAELGADAALHKMWELWAYLIDAFRGGEPYLKAMRKCRTLSAYRGIAAAVLGELPLAAEE